LHLKFAENRLEELEALRAEGKDVSDLAADLEDELNAAENEALTAQALGKDADALLAHVQAMFDKHIAVLQDVYGKVPDQAKDAIQKVIEKAKQHEANIGRGHHGKPEDAGKPTSSQGRNGDGPGRP
jgi:DNA repair exonuclease SbcCD ATPase subunit